MSSTSQLSTTALKAEDLERTFVVTDQTACVGPTVPCLINPDVFLSTITLTSHVSTFDLLELNSIDRHRQRTLRTRVQKSE